MSDPIYPLYPQDKEPRQVRCTIRGGPFDGESVVVTLKRGRQFVPLPSYPASSISEALRQMMQDYVEVTTLCRLVDGREGEGGPFIVWPYDETLALRGKATP